MTEAQIDTKRKIIEAASYLFGVKGFDGTSTREIGRRAGVNISSLNYHFKSKQNLMEEVAFFACEEFKLKIKGVAQREEVKTSADFALALYSTLIEDGYKSLNEFKLFLDAKEMPGELGDTPIGYNELAEFLRKDLGPKVPESEYLWINSVVFSYLMHTAIISMSSCGKQYIEKFLPEKHESSKVYIRQLVETMLRDLNNRYQ